MPEEKDARTIIEVRLTDGRTVRYRGTPTETMTVRTIAEDGGVEARRLVVYGAEEEKPVSTLDAWLASVSEALEKAVGHKLDRELTNGNWLALDGKFNGEPFRVEILGGRRLEVALRDGPHALSGNPNRGKPGYPTHDEAAS